ncbi:hypothetical protein GH733_009289, partial [Mirounga leonina]
KWRIFKCIDGAYFNSESFTAHQDIQHTPEERNKAERILSDVILKGIPQRSNFLGGHKVSTIYDRAENKDICKFQVKIRVGQKSKLSTLGNAYKMCSSSSMATSYRVALPRVCQSDLAWTGTEPMNISVGAEEQFYEKRRLLTVSISKVLLYWLHMGMLPQAQYGLNL